MSRSASACGAGVRDRRKVAIAERATGSVAMWAAPIAIANTIQETSSPITWVACAATEDARLCTRTAGAIAPDSKDS
eukprot:3536252-Pleurochrysis_carterae.AAC.2